VGQISGCGYGLMFYRWRVRVVGCGTGLVFRFEFGMSLTGGSRVGVVFLRSVMVGG